MIESIWKYWVTECLHRQYIFTGGRRTCRHFAPIVGLAAIRQNGRFSPNRTALLFRHDDAVGDDVVDEIGTCGSGVAEKADLHRSGTGASMPGRQCSVKPIRSIAISTSSVRNSFPVSKS